MEITVLGIQDRDATPTFEKRQEKRHGTGRNIYLGALLKSNLRLNFVLASSEWQKSMFRIRMWSYEIVSSCHCETWAIWAKISSPLSVGLTIHSQYSNGHTLVDMGIYYQLQVEIGQGSMQGFGMSSTM
ncbi:hypothetical protein FOXG_10603 [Fusarium oxysporum f. sp. lycopersici 4287]|uniref:Uncharacterized protein n=2 Tax=Fusarium oxysporum TaxID=5507 RepID=A0A0J9VHP6_FUSO4|nr:hypothetical protein FOXG_10603 [Fusarium oxysporum f. sp. lycopersici 4287]KNB10375.1 hypothetical protein FOXG_10603 [Fusarium oxysporum f. sp. lycopersici 4287]